MHNMESVPNRGGPMLYTWAQGAHCSRLLRHARAMVELFLNPSRRAEFSVTCIGFHI